MEDLNVIKDLLIVITIVVPVCLFFILIFLFSIDKSNQQIDTQLFHLRDTIEEMKVRTPTLEEYIVLTNNLSNSIDALVRTNQAILANNTKPQQRKHKNERKTHKVKA